MAADPLEKLEAAVKKLAADAAEQRKTLDEHSEALAEHGELLEDIASSVKQIQKTQTALTNAMTAGLKQLGIDKSLEIRVKRLGDAVFGSKH